MATKVFVDLDEEIILAVEKVLKGEGNQVILVVPESAMLVSSLVSLKLLSRHVYKHNKMIVLVTEDKTGLEISKKAGLVAVEKVSDVTGETWKKALALREKFKEEREELKRRLVNKRKEGEDVTFEEEDVKEEKTEKEDIKDKKEEKEEGEGKDYFQGMPQKPRLDGKLVRIAGFPLYAGGDIKDNAEALKDESAANKEEDSKDKDEKGDDKEDYKKEDEKPRIVPIPDPQPLKARAEEVENKPEPEPQSQLQSQPNKSSGNFVGRDLTSVAGAPTRKRRIGGGGGFMDKVKAFFTEGDSKKKLYIGGSILFLIIIFLLGYFVFPKATIELTLAEAAVPVNEDIRASLTQTTVDLNGMTIPAKKVELTKNASKSTPTTGKGETGSKAQGLADFFNKTAAPITVNSGTVITTIGDSSLKYIVKETVTVPPNPDSGVGLKEDVPIEAEKFGEKYNVGSSSRSYTIQGYTTSQLSATSISNSVTGGTTEEVTEVSQKDFDDLRNGLVEEIQSTLLGELEALVGDNEIKLDGTQKFAEPKVSPSHKVGDDVGNLDMSVEIVGSLFIVTESDLTDMANHLIKEKNKLEGEFEVKDLSDLQVGTATLNGDVATFNLRLEGSIKADIDEQGVKDQINGKGYLEAVTILKGLPDVKEVSVDFSPIWMPIKRMPTDDSKITVIIK